MNNTEAVKKLLTLLKDHKKTISIIMGCLIISTGLNLCIPLISRRIMDEGFIGGNKSILMELILSSFIIYILCCFIDMVKEKKRIDISAKIQYSLSEESFSHLMHMKSNYFSNKNYAEILNNINTDINNMTSIADEGVFFVVTQAFSMTGGVIGLFLIDYRMALLVLVFVPVKYFVMKYFARQRKKVMDEYLEECAKYARWFGDTVGGIREVKLFGIFEYKHVEFGDKQKRVIQKQKKLNLLSQWNHVLDSVLVQILTTVLYIAGANLVFELQLSVGSVFAFITYSAYVTGPISAILNLGYFLSGIIPSSKRYYEFMSLKEERQGQENCVPKPGEIQFQQVSFSYDHKNPVLEKVTFTIPLKSKIAIVGNNGSGKSTLIDLLLRLYEPDKGRILLAGKNIADFSMEQYRSMISIVSQDIYLFNDTIRNNICLYKWAKEEHILEICRESGLEEFISEVSVGYIVGQNGTMLSGGQKQKIALARALFQDRPIVILDEATSSTDYDSEQQINSLLQTKLQGKTVIVISHKKEIQKEVDYIFEVNEGKIAEQC